MPEGVSIVSKAFLASVGRVLGLHFGDAIILNVFLSLGQTISFLHALSTTRH